MVKLTFDMLGEIAADLAIPPDVVGTWLSNLGEGGRPTTLARRDAFRYWPVATPTAEFGEDRSEK